MDDLSNYIRRDSSYREAARDLDSLASWLESIGLRVDPTRIGTYRRQLLRAADAHENGSMESLIADEGQRPTLDALFEWSELALINRAVSVVDSTDLRRRLREFIKGPAAYRAEKPSTSSNRARDYAFELVVGAHLLRSGLPVEFHQDGDLRFRYRDSEFFVECKRPQAEHQINSHVKYALSKLEVRYRKASNPERARGFIALSATKLSNPHGQEFWVQSHATIQSGLSAALTDFAERYANKWVRPKDQRTVGALLEVRGIFFVREDNSVAVGEHLTMTDRLDLPASDRNLVFAVRDALHSELKFEQCGPTNKCS